MLRNKAITFLESGYVGSGVISRNMGMALKYINILMNGLLFYIGLCLILAFVQKNSNFEFLINDEIKIPILFSISYSVLNTLFLWRTKGRHINKVVSQNLMYSTTLCIILLGFIKNLIFIDTFASLVISAITLWRIITPYINNFRSSIKHAHFLSVFCTNILIIVYSTYFDYWSGIKTLGLPIWMLLFLGSTFWQLYYLDMNDDFPIVGNKLKKIAKKTCKAYHKYYPLKNGNK